MLVGVASGTGVGSLGMTPVSTSSGRVRACLEAVLVSQVMVVLCQKLTEADLLRSFVDIEMPSLIILAKMELNGFGANVWWLMCCLKIYRKNLNTIHILI